MKQSGIRGNPDFGLWSICKLAGMVALTPMRNHFRVGLLTDLREPLPIHDMAHGRPVPPFQ
jgi:hypothetical protein